MTALIIIVSVLAALFLLIFFLKCGVVFRYNSENRDFSVYLHILFLKIRVFPQNSKKKAKKPQKTKKAKHIAPAQKQNAQQPDAKKENLSDKTKKLSEFIKMLSIKLSELIPGIFGALSLDIKKLHIVVGGADDAAQAAVSYGAICAAAQTVFALENGLSKGKFKTDDIYLDVDYLLSGLYADFEIELGIRAIKVLSALYRAEDAYYSYKNNL